MEKPMIFLMCFSVFLALVYGVVQLPAVQRFAKAGVKSNKKPGARHAAKERHIPIPHELTENVTVGDEINTSGVETKRQMVA